LPFNSPQNGFDFVGIVLLLQLIFNLPQLLNALSISVVSLLSLGSLRIRVV